MNDLVYLQRRSHRAYATKAERQRKLVFIGAMAYTLIVGLSLGLWMGVAWGGV